MDKVIALVLLIQDDPDDQLFGSSGSWYREKQQNRNK
jgi:hypothetical protein